MVKDNKILISEIFKSIDGEGFHAGQATVFVRTFGCNLRCPWCFSKGPNGEYPSVLNEYGIPVEINQVKVGDRLLTKDPVTGEIQVCTVTNVMSHEAEEASIRRVNFGHTGYDRFSVTEEHPFYTDRWVPVSDIKEGETVQRAKTSDIIKFLVEKSFRDTLQDYAQEAYRIYERNHGSNYNFGNKNGRYNESCTKHNFYYIKYGLLEMDTSDYPMKSYWGNENLIVHHLDENPENDSMDNFVVIPRRIHDQLHSRGNNFSKQSPDPDRIELTYNRPRIKNPKHENTVINIETDTHSYLIKNPASLNAILVHNCDTKTTWTEEEHVKVYGHGPVWMSVDEIVEQVGKLEEGWPYKSICLTGGEPLLEENKEVIDQLITRFYNRSYAVNIETNGAVDYTYWIEAFSYVRALDPYGNRQGVSLITDWKLPSSKMNKLMVESNLKILRECDLIKCVITDDPADWEEFERICKSGTKAKIYLSPCFGQVTMSKIPQFVVEHPEYNITAQIQLHKSFYPPETVGV